MIEELSNAVDSLELAKTDLRLVMAKADAVSSIIVMDLIARTAQLVAEAHALLYAVIENEATAAVPNIGEKA